MGKDQSYVLFSLSQKQLARTIFPLGQIRKEDVRTTAKQAGMRIFDKPDSQEICFVPDNNYRRLLLERTPEEIRPGEIRNQAGELVGTHQGHQFYTIGQRHGLGISTRPGEESKPIYVTGKSESTNTVIVGDRPSLSRRKMTVDSLNWVAKSYLSGEIFRALVKIRHTHKPQPAMVEVKGKDSCDVTFDEPVNAITPGQAAVFYNDDFVIGGGWIGQVPSA
jgi:tRNA-specific 2-thiouridylase